MLVAWQAAPIRLDERVVKRILEGLFAAPTLPAGCQTGRNVFVSVMSIDPWPHEDSLETEASLSGECGEKIPFT